MQQGTHALDTIVGRIRTRPGTSWRVPGLMLVAVAGAGAVIVAVTSAGSPAAGVAVRTRQPPATVSVLAGSPAAVTARLARLLLAAAPSAVVADAASAADLTSASATARQADAPLLLMSPSGNAAAQAGEIRSAIKSLGARTVLTVGVAGRALRLPGVRLTTGPGALPSAVAAAPSRRVIVLLHRSRGPAGAALSIAAATTAAVAGARLIDLPGYDPQTDPAAIRALAAGRPARVIALGSRFGPARLLLTRLAVAETGVQLPGGGQVLFPMRRIVALYGAPGTPALGALGQQDLAASLARAKAAAAQYFRLSKVPVIPAFEIIATIAEGSAGPTGTYSDETSVATLRPWVRAATKAGMYVTLDLQPGRANFLAQAKHYQSLLKLPDVGLALDPEWKLGPRQLPLRQIGSVGIKEVNSVVSWLARLTARYHLPQKLLELHEFRLTMIRNIQHLDTSSRDLAIVVNMDGQGAPRTKQQSWAAVVAGAPRGVFFGWKDFYVKDTPMLGPRATLRNHPEPVLISYQ